MISKPKGSLLVVLLLFALGGVASSVRLVHVRAAGGLGRTRAFVREDFSPVVVDSLRRQLHPRTRLHADFELPALIALSFYPELRGIELTLDYGKITTTMQCQPRIGSLIGKGRRYEILINNDSTFDGVHLWHVPFNAQVGVIGHELAHIVDYERHSSFGVAGIGLDYLSEKGKVRIEHGVDSITVRAGLGWQLYDFAHFVLEESKATPAYKAFKRRVYMQPQEIADWMEMESESRE
jgi:hypothetical protein